MLKKIFTRQTRKYLYVVSIAALPVLAYYGLIEPEALPLAIPLFAAVLNLTPEEREYSNLD